MKKYLCSAALMLASCAPAQSYAVTTEQCLTIKSAALSVLETGARGSTTYQRQIIDNAEMIGSMFPEISHQGAMLISYKVQVAPGAFMTSKTALVSDVLFDKCLQNDPKFNAKYFKGEVK